MRKYLWLTGIIGLMIACPTFAQEQATETKQDESAEVQEQEESEAAKEFAALNNKAQELQKLTREKMMAAQKEMAGEDPDAMMEAMTEIQKEMDAENDEVSKEMVAVAAKYDEDAETSLKAIKYLLVDNSNVEFQKAAGELVLKHHLENEELPTVLSQLMMPTQSAKELMEQVVEKSTNPEIKGQVAYILTNYVAQAMDMAPMLANNPQLAEMYPAASEYLKSLLDADPEAILADMRKVVEEHGDIEMDGSTVGELIGQRLKAMEAAARVAIGKEAPEIEGPDIDGEVFKLSDYRGKVVMLDFWGDW